MFKKQIAFLVAMLLVTSLFAGCSTGKTNASATPSPAATVSAAPASAAPAGEPITFPLAEAVTFTIWNGPMSATAGMTTPNDSIAYQEAEKRTNVHIEWNQPSQGTENEQFNLIVASEEYPDAFFGGNYVGGLDKFINDEIIIDIMPYLDQYGQNFLKVAKATDDTWKRNITDMGRMPGFYNISKEIEPTWMGPLIREDWLKDMGLNSPVTYDDWYTMLTRAKAEKGAKRGYALPSANGLDDALLAGFNLVNGFFAQDGVVKYGPYEPALLDYLTMVNKWYGEGLIDPDYSTYAGFTYFGAVTPLMLNNELMAFRHFWTMFDPLKAQSKDPNFQLVAAPAPMKSAGDTRKVTMYNIPDSRVGTNVDTITTKCADIPTLVAWFDYFYSDEGEILADYGVEGQAFEYDANGKPVLTDLITKNPDGLSQPDAFALYTIGSFHSRQYDWARPITPATSPYSIAAGGIWDSNWDKEAGYRSMLGVTLTEEESAEYTPMINDINTYITETCVQIINGTKPLSEFDSYREQLKAMGIERCIEIYQTAFDRYMAR